MTDTQKIKKDFLKLLGNDNPTKEDLQKIECIPDNQLLKPIIEDSKKKGISLRMIAIRYNVGIHVVAHISKTSKSDIVS